MQQMGNYTAWGPCLLLSFSHGRGKQKLDLKGLFGGGRTAEPVLGLSSSKLPCARGEKWGALAFCPGLPAHTGQCLGDGGGWGEQPAMVGACPGLPALAGTGWLWLALVLGQPVLGGMTSPNARVHVAC